MRAALVVALALLGPALTGCLGKDEAQDPPAQVTTLPPESAGELGRPGRIAGIVTDISVTPLSGATVRLLERNVSLTTGADGTYLFRDLAPATYLVRAEATGFIGQTYQVDVFRDQVTILDIVLPAVPVAAPYHETAELIGRIVCKVVVGTETAGQSGAGCPVEDPNERARFEVPVDPKPLRILVELIWESESDLARELVVSVSTSMLGDQDTVVGEMHGGSVLRLDVPGSALDRFYPEGGTIRVDVGIHPSMGDEEGALIGGAFQQDFTALVTAFHNDAGPTEFTAIGA